MGIELRKSGETTTDALQQPAAQVAGGIAIARAEKDISSSSGQYLEATRWLANHYSHPFARSAIERGLPDDFENMDISILARVLSAVGLKSKIVNQQLAKIDPLILPCVLISNEGVLYILTNLESDNRIAVLVNPSQIEKIYKLPFAKLQEQFRSQIVLVTPDQDASNARMDPDAIEADHSPHHWLWQPIRQHSGAWFQILLAALGSNILALALPIFVMNVYDRVIPNLVMVTLWSLAGGVIIALLLDLVLKTVRTNVLELAGRRIDMKVGSTLFKQAMDIKLLERKGGAATIASQIRDFESVREFFASSSFIAVIDLLFVGIFIAVLWLIVGPIAIVPLVAVPIVIILALIAQIPIGTAIKKSQQLSAKRHLVLIESLLGIETIKSVNGERVMQREWENAVAASSRISGKSRFWSTFAISGTMLVQQAVSVAIIVWGVYLVAKGEISVGGLIAANILAGRVLAPLGNISQTLLRAQQAIKSLATISELMKLPTDNAHVVSSELTVTNGKIEISNLNFTYPDSKVPALENVSFNVKPGEVVAILGRVGSGKTTLGKMLIKLLEPDSGTILVDGYEIRQYETGSLRDAIGYLPQDPELFTGTIRENLLLGKPDASEEEIKRALYFAGMDFFIAENPDGLNQFVGEKGNRLSGGQRQAISLARLLLRQPKLLYLDEPTNAMDHTTEAIVIARLKELVDSGVSMIVSTHRHSFANIAERLVVLDKGKKILDGPRAQVLKKLTLTQPKAKV